VQSVPSENAPLLHKQELEKFLLVVFKFRRHDWHSKLEVHVKQLISHSNCLFIIFYFFDFFKKK
jgi:hypothetical protein